MIKNSAKMDKIGQNIVSQFENMKTLYLYIISKKSKKN